MKLVRIEFSTVPNNGNTFAFSYTIPPIDATQGPRDTVANFTFKTVNDSNPGTVLISQTLNEIAVNFENVIRLLFPDRFIIFRVNNIVSIYSENNSDFFYTELSPTNFAVLTTTNPNLLQSPYINNIAYTLDPKFFILQSLNQNCYIQLTATVKTYEFFNNIEETTIVPQKFILYNGKEKFNIGQIVHRLMSKFTIVNNTVLQYKPAVVSIVVSEFTQDSLIKINEQTLPDIKFIAGLSTQSLSLEILDINKEMNRVTINSFAYLNLVVPPGAYKLNVYRNNNIHSSLLLPNSNGTILSQKVSFNNFYQGDIIKYNLVGIDATVETAISKSFAILPEGNHFNMIVWENEFLLQSAIEMNGGFLSKSDLEFYSQKTTLDLVEKLDHLLVTETPFLTIDTGWLIKSDMPTIKSLMRSKKVWLLYGDTTIDLRPISKSLPYFDSERELYSQTIEFQINKKYNEEDYTF